MIKKSSSPQETKQPAPGRRSRRVTSPQLKNQRSKRPESSKNPIPLHAPARTNCWGSKRGGADSLVENPGSWTPPDFSRVGLNPRPPWSPVLLRHHGGGGGCCGCQRNRRWERTTVKQSEPAHVWFAGLRSSLLCS